MPPIRGLITPLLTTHEPPSRTYELSSLLLRQVGLVTLLELPDLARRKRASRLSYFHMLYATTFRVFGGLRLLP